MSERYLITGVQLGLLTNYCSSDAKKMLEDIQDEQFIGHSNNAVNIDADMILNSGLYSHTKDEMEDRKDGDIIEFKVKIKKK
jgi:hypothetical protein